MRYWIFWHRDSARRRHRGALLAMSDFLLTWVTATYGWLVVVTHSIACEVFTTSTNAVGIIHGRAPPLHAVPSGWLRRARASRVGRTTREKCVGASGRQQAGGWNLSGNQFFWRHFVPFVGWTADFFEHEPNVAVHSSIRGLWRCSLTSPRSCCCWSGTRPGMSGQFIAGPHAVIHTFTLTPGDTVE